MNKSKPLILLNKPHSQAGFTLIEVAIALLIGAILVGSFSAGLMIYVKRTDLKVTQHRLNEVHNAVEQFLARYNRYPCPAVITAAADTAEYGTEDCSGNTTRGLIMGGAAPTRTLNLPDEYIQDAWRSRFIYAVSKDQTSDVSYTQDGGVLTVTDINGNNVITPAGRGHYVIVSPGEDKIGAYDGSSGTLYLACDTGVANMENCDNDATFIRSAVMSEGDDLMYAKGQTTLSDAIPAGAVIAFNLGACPSGWTAFDRGMGRVIVGAGTLAAQSYTEGVGGNERTWVTAERVYALGETGGWLTWQQAIEELPAHHHGIPMDANIFQPLTLGSSVGVSYDGASGTNVNQITEDTGDSVPMENMPPYVSLLYCQKN